MSKEFELPYRDSSLRAAIPRRSLSFVLDIEDEKGAESETQCIIDSLRCPIERSPLRDAVSQDDKVVVIVTDNPGPAPTIGCFRRYWLS